MSLLEGSDSNKTQFCWGKKRGIGGAKKDIQFYESFTFDGIDYSLYDCVYLFKDDELEPYIGKIVKIWEQSNGKKKIKILWFFRPNEILNYLGDSVPLEKEIFLASGEGVGAYNINPLEAIAGKCCVICTSKDERNAQPAKEVSELADYNFFRTFDVASYIISETIPDKIAGIEVKCLLNRDEDLKPNSVSMLDAGGIDKKVKTASDSIPDNLSKSESLRLLEGTVKEEKFGEIPTSVSKNANEEKLFDERKRLPDEKKIKKSKNNLNKNEVGENRTAVNHAERKSEHSEKRTHSSTLDDKPSKKMRLTDDSVVLQKNSAVTRKLKVDSHEDDSGKGTVHLEEASEKIKHSDEKTSEAMLVEHKPEVDTQTVEVLRRPDMDRSKWFKINWEIKLQKADVQGTLVYIDNLDPSYTSEELEDIIYHAFKQSCSAKVIPWGTYQNRHYGQAYIIFKTSATADLVLEKIKMGCLILPNGRSLIASKGFLKTPKKSLKYAGHLIIDKLRNQSHEEWKKAVATSHCSQPNTIEYEMAMEWMLMQEKSVNWFNRLHKAHGEARNQGLKSLKTK